MEKVEIATRFLRTRREVLFLRRQAFGEAFSAVQRERLRTLEVELKTLAWVFGVDVELMNTPKRLELLHAPDRVEVTRIQSYDCYLVEVPANATPGFETEYWAAFLAPAHLCELYEAIERVLAIEIEADAPAGSGTPTEARVVLLDRARVLPREHEADAIELPVPPQGA